MTQEKTSRRAFLNKLWAAAGTLAVAEIVLMTVAFFKPRQPKASGEREESLVIAGPVENFEPGSVTAFVRGRFYLARLDDGGFMALSRSCTHLHCTVPWVADEDRFICPCHSSAFNIRGQVLDPPATRPLDVFEVAIRNDIVQVDTSRPIKRNDFAADQVTYPQPT
jgi:cytochrome b6-f complex iron-sulfur subunit